MDWIDGGCMDDDVNRIAEKLVYKLVNIGFSINRHDSATTNSIYLIIDNCACGVIRVSDHAGGKSKYNIGNYIQSYRVYGRKFKRYFYKPNRINNLIKRIHEDRKSKISMYGERQYIESIKRKGKYQYGYSSINNRSFRDWEEHEHAQLRG